ncbi:Z1 domain-containing protein [Cellulomonas dongxiuzhuiae]|uniref:Z1 domain-containing protein n=1 Tax=Cellulomonas dongxiuzhuiae TaxID=2819979 RepID=UPI001AAF6A86|nr:Z1 domain-containing protein [Cellulomonas dongxiuzhuiae]MBO3087753.1 hypothetical protein [Cellulomonas dongxiuzhuiae]
MSTAADVTLWTPVAGPHLRDLLERSRLTSEESALAEEQTLRILGRCREPEWTPGDAGAELVVGAVQSGKTLSFTALIAAAHDNGFPMVIVLAGTKRNLRRQTYDRLLRDLEMGGDGGVPRWNPRLGLGATDTEHVVRLVEAWQKKPRPRTLTTTVAVVMKNAAGLRSVRDLLRTLTDQLGAVPTLFVDDEADQAGLNVARAGAESSTYRAIATARACAPSHSYVLYTATPQAPLLISLEDALSPRSVTVLRHGAGYVGGQDLFVDGRRGFVRDIDDEQDALDASGIRPPRSLERAFSTYLVALAVAQARLRPRPLTMLVHPSATRGLHDTYERWIGALRKRVTGALRSGDVELMQQMSGTLLRPAYDDLETTGGTLVEGEPLNFDEVVAELDAVIDHMKVRVVNSDDGHEIPPDEWKSATGWVVIGGNKLDRGFTVENLAVTYMPRGAGVGNADTVQQRGRFFGYKRAYIDLLRGWFAPSTLHVFERYVEHERIMRDDLAALDSGSLPLRSWRRAFLLDPAMKPTRRAVVRLDTDDHHLRPGWFLQQTHLLAAGAEPGASALATLDAWRAASTSDVRDRRPTGGPRNTRLRLNWDDVAPVLAGWNGSPADRARVYALLMLAGETSIPSGAVEVVLMNGGEPRSRGLTPTSRALLDESGGSIEDVDDLEALQVNNLMQGANPADGSVYLGDAAFVTNDVPTIQVHVVDIDLGAGAPVRRLAVAIFLPKGVGGRLILQA